LSNDEGESDSGFAGHIEKFSIDYLMQISQPMRDIKQAYVKLKREWRDLLPDERMALFNLMRASWLILKNSTQALCEVSGYPFEKRLDDVEEKIRIKYSGYIQRLKELDADGKRDGRGSSLGEHIDNYKRGYTLERIMACVQEAERALYRTGVLLSPLYGGHSLIEDYRQDVLSATTPIDLGVVEAKPHPKRTK